MEFKDLIIPLLLSGLFIIAMISFGIYLANENNANNILAGNEALNRSYNNINRQLLETENSTESQKQAFFKDIPVIGQISIVLKSITGTARIFFSGGISLLDSMFTLVSETLGIPSIVISVLTSIFLIIGVLLAWKLFRTGV